MNYLIAIFSGGLLSLVFPKFNFAWLAWLALVPFFYALGRSEKRTQALGVAGFFGLTFFALHFFWFTSLYDFVGWWIFPGWLALSLYQTLFLMLYVLILSWLSRAGEIFYPIFAAAFWVGIEWLRALGPFGMTGGDLGYSQVQFLPLIQIASFSSVYGVSFLVVLVNAALAQVLRDRRHWAMLSLALAFVLAATAWGASVLQQPRPASSQTLKLALIQPNIAQKDKLNQLLLPQILNNYQEMTRQIIGHGPEVIIWPETALMAYVLREPQLLNQLKRLAREANAWLVFGTPHYAAGKAYNSLVALSPAGEVVSRYDKQHLVPFSEYLPLRKLLFPLLKGVGYYDDEFSPGTELKLLKIKESRVAAAICFESLFPSLISERADKGAAFILLVTNDAWFDDSAAPYFHLNAGIFRAIENRKYFVQVGNTGLTAVIDPYGRVIEKTDLDRRQILTFELPLS